MRHRSVLFVLDCFHQHSRLLIQLCCCAALVAVSGCSASSTGDDLPGGSVRATASPGKPFAITLRFDSVNDCSLQYHWQDFRGEALTEPVPLPLNRNKTINSFSGVGGYLGLVLTTDCPDLDDEEGFAGGRREMGFAILPEPRHNLRANGERSPFGMVHARFEDPWLGPWTKTLTWHTTSAKWWKYEMETRAANGFIELPMINGEFWDSDDSKPVSSAELEALEARAENFFAAWPQGKYWELGLEENIKGKYEQPWYWKNLTAKVKAVRKAAKRKAPETRFTYQIANRDLADIEAFASSDAARLFDILALHPYAWPDFPSPDQWLSDYLRQVRGILQNHGLDMPIWFTEVGAPHHGNAPGLFFGYPDTQAYVTGLTRYQSVTYMLKMHAIALHTGVEKIFWYNYRDRGVGNDYAENFFGMIDYWGYSKPVRVAYARMLSCLNGYKPDGQLAPGRDVLAYTFRKGEDRVIIAWKRSDGIANIELTSLGIANSNTLWAGDPMGNTYETDDGRISVSAEPVWIATGSAVNDCRLPE